MVAPIDGKLVRLLGLEREGLMERVDGPVLAAIHWIGPFVSSYVDAVYIAGRVGRVGRLGRSGRLAKSRINLAQRVAKNYTYVHYFCRFFARGPVDRIAGARRAEQTQIEAAQRGGR